MESGLTRARGDGNNMRGELYVEACVEIAEVLRALDARIGVEIVPLHQALSNVGGGSTPTLQV